MIISINCIASQQRLKVVGSRLRFEIVSCRSICRTRFWTIRSTTIGACKGDRGCFYSDFERASYNALKDGSDVSPCCVPVECTRCCLGAGDQQRLVHKNDRAKIRSQRSCTWRRLHGWMTTYVGLRESVSLTSTTSMSDAFHSSDPSAVADQRWRSAPAGYVYRRI